MEKVKILKSQAELLDGLLTTKNVALILQLMADWKSVIRSEKEMTDLHHWYINDTLTVSKALIIGYEVELSKEDKVREVVQSYCGGTVVSQWVLDDIRMIYEG